MIVEIQIPDLSQWQDGFPNYYLGLIFKGNRPKDDAAHALLNGYIRLVEGAVRFYEAARKAIILGWNTHDKLMLGAFNDATNSFEACVTNMYRAATFMERIRGTPAIDTNFKNTLKPVPIFVRRIKAIREIRRAIHHLDEAITGPGVTTGMPIFLVTTGDIVRRDDRQEIKTIDRLQIGECKIKFDAPCSLGRPPGRDHRFHRNPDCDGRIVQRRPLVS